MSEFKVFDGADQFLKPEKLFLLLFMDRLAMRKYIEWFDDEEEFENRVKEVKNNPSYSDIKAIEIGSYREINVDEI